MTKTKKGLIITGIIVLVVAFAVVIRIIQTGADIIDKTMNADNVLYNYEWFKQQNQDFTALSIKIENSEKSVVTFKEEAGARSDWTYEDKNEYSRLVSISDGLKYQIEDLVAKYNARSEMANRTLFKDNDLPEKLKYQ